MICTSLNRTYNSLCARSLGLPTQIYADLVKWAQLPVALWNDHAYDSNAIYTGSATVVNGQVVLIYPGICRKEDWPSCNTSTNLPLTSHHQPLACRRSYYYRYYLSTHVLHNTSPVSSSELLTKSYISV